MENELLNSYIEFLNTSKTEREAAEKGVRCVWAGIYPGHAVLFLQYADHQ